MFARLSSVKGSTENDNISIILVGIPGRELSPPRFPAPGDRRRCVSTFSVRNHINEREEKKTEKRERTDARVTFFGCCRRSLPFEQILSLGGRRVIRPVSELRALFRPVRTRRRCEFTS